MWNLGKFESEKFGCVNAIKILYFSLFYGYISLFSLSIVYKIVYEIHFDKYFILFILDPCV